MALYNELPVYQASYQLLLSIFTSATQFKKEFKYSLGDQIKQETIQLVRCIYRANSRRDKKSDLEKAREHLEVVRLYIRLLKDLQQLSLKKFVQLNQQVELVSRQLTGWYKSIRIQE